MNIVTNTNREELYDIFLRTRRTFRRTFLLSCILYFILFAAFLGVLGWSYTNLGFWTTTILKKYLGLGSEAWAYFLAGSCIVLAPALIRTHNKARTEYKNLMLYPALQRTFGKNLQVLPNGRMERSVLQAAHILQEGEKYQANDLMVGTYRGLLFRFCDFSIRRFHGQVFALECKQIFPQRLCLVQKGFHRAVLPPNVTKRLKSGDEVFDAVFSCFAVESAKEQIVLTDKMQTALQLIAEMTDEKCMISLSGDMLYLALQEKRDSFEPPLFRPCNLEKEMQVVCEQLQSIVALLDCLTTDIFKKYNGIIPTIPTIRFLYIPR